MTTEVKPGQVWQDKNSGKREVVLETDFDAPGFVLLESGMMMREGHLIGDYVLVKDAP